MLFTFRLQAHRSISHGPLRVVDPRLAKRGSERLHVGTPSVEPVFPRWTTWRWTQAATGASMRRNWSAKTDMKALSKASVTVILGMLAGREVGLGGFG